ncbi:cytochrome c1 [Aestuariibius insulae]|uniref:cytochrome c1 n=1 Tax=Aestuariibius insulae TaxID=2058287 RepID=UPI00345EC2F0
MIRTTFTAALIALGLSASGAMAAGSYDTKIIDYDFPFEGPFGSYDQMQLQRGLQVYTEVCAACHGLRYVAFRNLHDEGGPGLPEDQVAAYADFYEIWDPTLFDGEGDFRAATPNDKFPQSSLSNAPDLSLMAKARAGFHGPYGTGISQFINGMGGPEYIASLLTGYTGEDKEEAGVILYENTAYPGGWIAMAPPLYGDDVIYADDAPTDIDSVSKDVAAFLMWTAEPKLNQRKQAGLTGVIFLSVLAVLLYLTNKRLWAPIKRRTKDE